MTRLTQNISLDVRYELRRPLVILLTQRSMAHLPEALCRQFVECVCKCKDRSLQ